MGISILTIVSDFFWIIELIIYKIILRILICVNLFLANALWI